MSDDDARATARRYLSTVSETLRRVETDCLDDIVTAADLVIRALRGGGKILVCGNGGSAADAQHFATEFVSTLTLDHVRSSIPAIALTTDTSLLTAVSNDFGFEHVFERQVEALGAVGDVLVGISTSGNSLNVVRAAELARTRELSVIALTGESGGKLAPLADVAVRVPSSLPYHVQECHIAVEQLIALLVERELHPSV
ncbi:MAG TPA: SIS domain-containing protein [Actinomycetota bacterium]|jgi:D-sedoheptulose 7-phosphate isomerase|nr:SIS domain-containing protein [Actinomycetota bacterium]